MSWILGSFAEEIKKEFLSFSEVKEGHNVLDVGTGSGFAVTLLAKNVDCRGRMYSIDPSENALVKAFKRIKDERLDGIVILRKARVEELQFPDGFFNRVTSIMSFHHFSNPVKSLREMYRVFKPDGFFVIVDWTKKSTVAPHPKNNYTPRIFS